MRDETPEDIRYVRTLYAALVTMCDSYLGTILDFMDAHDMWKDTMLIVNTDHGFLLGEHDWWGKGIMPPYEEIRHTPLFVYDPVSGIHGERREGLTSAIDLPVTILKFFGLEIPKDMQGIDLLPMIRENRCERKACLFGFHGGHVAVTDGTYTYFRAPLASQEQNCYEYTLMPTRMRERSSVEDLQKAEFVGPLPNSKGCKVLRTPGHGSYISQVNYGTKLYCVAKDPQQKSPLDDPVQEAWMAELLKEEMEKADAPAEQFERLGLMGRITPESVLAGRKQEEEDQTPRCIPVAAWSQEAKNVWRALTKLMPPEGLEAATKVLAGKPAAHLNEAVSLEDIEQTVRELLPKEQAAQRIYFMYTPARVE